jgi:phosphatidate cytidylyltransferase
MNAPVSGRFADLGPRVLSAVLLAGVGGGAVWLGGAWFTGFVALAVTLMLWEMLRMLAPGMAGAAIIMLAVAAGAMVALTSGMGVMPVVAGAALPVALAFLAPRGVRLWFALYGAALVLAGEALVGLREGFGLWGLAWLVLVVVASDIMGYFAGKTLGGPKLWRRISPKKTWSGTVAGWIGAAGVGALFSGVLGAAGPALWGLALISVVVAMAGQAGDIVESALKRRAGVKDSSGLIPGHGGFLDRFDAMMAAALMVLLMERLGLFAPTVAMG